MCHAQTVASHYQLKIKKKYMESDDFRVKEEDLVRPFKIKACSKDDLNRKLNIEMGKQFVEKKVENMIDPIFQPLFRALNK